MFHEPLETLLDKIPGGCYAAVVDSDGIEVQGVRRRLDETASDVINAEWVNYMQAMLQVLEELDAGRMEESNTMTDQYAYYSMALMDGCFLMMIVRRGLVTSGQTRFYLKVAATQCMDILSS